MGQAGGGVKCDELRGRFDLTFNCCGSCHDDWETIDYEACYVTIDSAEWHVCCAAAAAYRAKQ